MRVSRNIRHGSVVTWRGDKLVLSGKKGKPIAVFNLESEVTGFTVDGTPFHVRIPRGFRTFGEASVKVSST